MSARIDPAEYVLGMLEGEELQEARRLEAQDQAFAAEVRALGRVGARLDALEADEWNSAPAIPPVPAPKPAPEVRGRSWRERLGSSFTVRPVIALACAALLLGVGVGAGLLVAGGDDGPGASPGQVVALERFDDGPAGASGQATVADIGGVPEVTIDTRGLAPSAPGTSYEVWMIRDAEHMVGLGRFRVGAEGRATVTLPVTVDTSGYPIMDISIQPDGGPATHSGVSVLRSPSTPA